MIGCINFTLERNFKFHLIVQSKLELYISILLLLRTRELRSDWDKTPWFILDFGIFASPIMERPIRNGGKCPFETTNIFSKIFFRFVTWSISLTLITVSITYVVILSRFTINHILRNLFGYALIEVTKRIKDPMKMGKSMWIHHKSYKNILDPFHVFLPWLETWRFTPLSSTIFSYF